jgi:hypothetical protein
MIPPSFVRKCRARSRRVLALALLTLFALSLAAPVAAQEGGWKEPFDGAALDGWELGPDVAVADGALLIGPGNFAARFGNFQDFRFSFRVRFDDPEGAFSLIYQGREESEYAIRFLPDEILLERRSGGPLVPLTQTGGSILDERTWNDVQLDAVSGSHRLQVNSVEILSIQDDAPLRPGDLIFINMGPVEVAIDDLAFEPQPVGGVVGELPPEGPPGEPLPQEGQPEATPPALSTPTPTAAPSGLAGLLDQLAGGGADPLQLSTIVINLGLAALFSLLLGLAYVHWGLSLSNRRSLAANFLLITVTTTFIILVVRSSVALSLGLVGALSIVRFRAAIKEPEELAYLFFAIGLGIGLGDNQRVLTAATLIVGLILIGLVRLFRRAGSDMNLHLTVASQGTNPVQLDSLLETIKAHSTRVRLLRFDENDSRLETSFLVEFKRLNDLQAARAALRELSPGLEITFLDNRGVI